ncbi:hypothetical protein KDA11_00945, partial [Candidatus Saccharibacteria bacterium]|nr:hypothetical protein [Candidatus Saccharibacteria bacterium]
VTGQQTYDSAQGGGNLIRLTEDVGVGSAALRFQCNETFVVGEVARTDTNASLFLGINSLVNFLALGQQTIIDNGTTQLAIQSWQIFSPTNPAPVNLIDNQDGTMIYNVNVLACQAPNVTIVNSTSTTGALFMDSYLINSVADNNIVVNTSSGQNDINIANMFVSGANSTGIVTSGFTQLGISTIQANAAGSGGIVVNGPNGGLDANVGTINTNDGSALVSTSPGNIKLSFQEIQTQTAANAISLTGTGDNWLGGKIINTHNSASGIKVGSGGIGDTTSLSLRLDSFFSSTANQVMQIDTPGGTVNLDIMDFRSGTGGDTTVAAIDILDGNVYINNGNYNFASVTNTPGIQVAGNARLVTNMNDVLSNGPAIVNSSTNDVWYNAQRTDIISDNPVAIMNAAAASTGIFSVGGYMRTSNANCVLFSGANIPAA